LLEALRVSRQVIPCFIFDPRQIEPHPYQSKRGLQSLDDLQQQLHEVGGKLALYHALPEQVVKQQHEQQRIQAVFVNRDYTPYSRRRDDDLAAVGKQLGIALHTFPGILLNEPEQVVKNNKTPYQMFTAFYNQARQIPADLPQAVVKWNFFGGGFRIHSRSVGLVAVGSRN